MPASSLLLLTLALAAPAGEEPTGPPGRAATKVDAAFSVGPDATPAAAHKTAREAVRRALPFIERQGVRWMEQKRCASCHHSTFLVWSHNAAAERGVAVDPGRLREWTEWVRDFRSLRGRDREGADPLLDHETFRDSPDEVAQLLLGRRQDDDADAERRWVEAMASFLLEGQQPDGRWKPGGQLPMQKRPKRETAEATTMWALLALREADPQDEEATRLLEAEERAAAWLGDDTVGESAEWGAVRLLWLRSRGDSRADATRQTLLDRQQADGGWGWRLDDPSDALGTGIALYALLRDGFDRDADAVRRGVAFLLRSQRDDGSWPVRGTKAVRKDRVTPTATYWGTCWATIALLESLADDAAPVAAD